jgi:polysaccharide biosynthesis protein PelA
VVSHLRLEDADKNVWDGVVIGPWGGAAFIPYVLEEGLAGIRRWILEPFKFLRDALDLQPMPIPDVTTESGRRIWTSHIDGDAFVSRAEIRGTPYTATVILDQILKVYQTPHTVSVVEGEVGPAGLKPHDSPRFEAIARDIFRLPHVELASHTYSHPFFWEDAEAGKTEPHGVEPVHLRIPGYKFDLERDLKGSIDYINTRLAPPGKKVKVLLWSGSCSPSKEAVALTQKLGVFNVNGGGATRTFDIPTLTRGSAMGIPKGDGAYQVFAPVENENVYTNDFLGPYYGYRHAIETFKLTEEYLGVPRRLGLITIYYHFYSAAKQAALVALKEVYDWAMKQETTPLYLSEYAAKVLAFQEVSIARSGPGGQDWEIGSLGALHTVRLPQALGYPDLAASAGVAGVRDVPQGRYVTLVGSSAVLRLSPSASPDGPSTPHLVHANGQVLAWRAEGGADKRVISLQIRGNVPLVITVGGTDRPCVLRGPAGNVPGRRVGKESVFALPAKDTGEATLDCRG